MLLRLAVNHAEVLGAEDLEPVSNRTRNELLPSAVQTCSNCQTTREANGYVIPRYFHHGEAIGFLEINQRAITPEGINEVRQALTLTHFNGFCDEGIVGGFVSV